MAVLLLISNVPQPEPFVLRPQLADCCHFTSSLFSYAFYLRAGEEFSVMGSRFLVLGFSEEVVIERLFIG